MAGQSPIRQNEKLVRKPPLETSYLPYFLKRWNLPIHGHTWEHAHTHVVRRDLEEGGDRTLSAMAVVSGITAKKNESGWS